MFSMSLIKSSLIAFNLNYYSNRIDLSIKTLEEDIQTSLPFDDRQDYIDILEALKDTEEILKKQVNVTMEATSNGIEAIPEILKLNYELGISKNIMTDVYERKKMLVDCNNVLGSAVFTYITRRNKSKQRILQMSNVICNELVYQVIDLQYQRSIFIFKCLNIDAPRKNLN